MLFDECGVVCVGREGSLTRQKDEWFKIEVMVAVGKVLRALQGE